MRMDDSLDALTNAFTVDGSLIQAEAANIPVINQAIKLAMQAVQDMKDRCSAYRTKHLVAMVLKHG